MQQLIQFLVYTNTMVALSAFCFYKITETIFQFHDNYIGYFIFFSTLFCYNYMRYFHFLKLKSVKYLPVWVCVNKNVIYCISFLSAFLSLYFMLLLGLSFVKLIMPVLCILVFYTPGVKISGVQYGIRNIPMLKIFIISSVWVYVTLLLPLIHNAESFNIIVVNHVFQRFLFIIAICIPFDMRDMNVDTIKTIPNTIGIAQSKFFGLFCLLITQCLLIFQLVNSSIDWPLFIALFLTFETTSIIIYLSDAKKSLFFYGIVVEGLSIIMCLFVLISNFF